MSSQPPANERSIAGDGARGERKHPWNSPQLTEFDLSAATLAGADARADQDPNEPS